MRGLQGHRLVVALLFAAPGVWSADLEQRQGPATLRLTVDRVEGENAELRLSSEARLLIQVEGKAPLVIGEGDEATLQKQVAALKAAAPWYSCRGQKPLRTSLAEQRERWQLEIILDPGKDGMYELRLAPLEVAEGGGTRQEYTWKPIPLRVTTEVASTDLDKELRDITPPEEIILPPSWTRFLPWIGLGTAALGATAALWSWVGRRLPRKVILTPEQWALRELDRLNGEGLAESGALEVYYTRLADIVRSFLEHRYSLPATHQTTAEFLEAMRGSPHLGESQRALLREFLQRCDMVKFAQETPGPEECQAIATMARAFVGQAAPGAPL